MASKIYHVSIWQNDAYLDTIMPDEERYSVCSYSVHRIPVDNGRITKENLEEVVREFNELYQLGRDYEEYPDLDFEKEVKEAVKEYRGNWAASMLCELKIDTYAILTETDNDMTYNDWCLAELYKRTMEERAKRRGVKTLVS